MLDDCKSNFQYLRLKSVLNFSTLPIIKKYIYTPFDIFNNYQQLRTEKTRWNPISGTLELHGLSEILVGEEKQLQFNIINPFAS